MGLMGIFKPQIDMGTFFLEGRAQLPFLFYWWKHSLHFDLASGIKFSYSWNGQIVLGLVSCVWSYAIPLVVIGIVMGTCQIEKN